MKYCCTILRAKRCANYEDESIDEDDEGNAEDGNQEDKDKTICSHHGYNVEGGDIPCHSATHRKSFLTK